MMFWLAKWAVFILSFGFVELERGSECELCGMMFEDNEEDIHLRHLMQVHAMKIDRLGNPYFEDPKWASDEEIE